MIILFDGFLGTTQPAIARTVVMIMIVMFIFKTFRIGLTVCVTWRETNDAGADAR